MSATANKIRLTNIFGKASALTGTAAGGYVYFELARVLIAATDTQNAFNPANHVAPGLVALGISLAAGCGGMYLGHLKRRLVDEFNLQVKRELESAGFEIVEDISPDTGRRSVTYRRIETADYTPARSGYNGSFWDGFYLSSLMRSGGSSSGAARGGFSSSSSRSGGGGKNNGQGVAILVAAIVLAAAAAAAAFVSYKSLKLNFSKVPDLLTSPDPALLAAAPAVKEPAPV